MNKTTETGCIFAGHHGWHAHYAVINMAVENGMTLTPSDRVALDAYIAQRDVVSGIDDVPNYILNQGGLLDEAEQYLNDNIAADNHSFGWQDGEFFYMPDSWWDETETP